MGKQTLGSLLTFLLLETLFSSDARAESVKPIAAKWLAEVNRMSLDLKGQTLKLTDWQDRVETLFSPVDRAEFLTYVDFAKLTKDIRDEN